MVSSPPTLMTVAQFRLWRDLPDNTHRRFELIEGEVIEMPAPTNLHNLVAFEIAHQMRRYLDTHPIGYVFGDNTDYILNEHTIVKPDASFISFERVPVLPDYFHMAPDIAVEVVSPSNTERDIRHKMELYITHGTRLVWVIYVEEQTAYVYRSEPDGTINLRILNNTDTLEGGDVLAGFQVHIARLFPMQPPS